MPEHLISGQPLKENTSCEDSCSDQQPDTAKTAEQDSTAHTDNAHTDKAAGDAACAEKEEQTLDIMHPEDALDSIQLEQLPPAMQEACAKAGWNKLMPVQSAALPYLMDGRDIMIQSRTGSGKTGTYLLPLVMALRSEKKHPQALVLVPTRELAVQVAHEAGILFEGTGIAAVALYGGVGYQKQLAQLREGAQLVIGTPGRVLDHLLKRSLTLEHLRALVFDEADRMLSIGFYPDMKEVQRYLPKKRIYTSLLSATFPQYVLNLAAEFMLRPCMLSLSQKQVYAASVEHCFTRVDRMDKDRALVRLIETENPASAIIFCNTKADVHYVTGVLQGFGYNADELSADLTQAKREEVMLRIREGKTRLLVATDVAARGIDIPDLSHVFLYSPPEDHESYIHRSGRTGRANAAGTVISLVDIMEYLELERIAAHYSLSLHEIPNPTDEDVAKVVSGRLLAILEANYRRLKPLEKTRLRRYTAFAKELASLTLEDENDGAGINLLAMLLDACHHNTLDDIRLPKAASSRRDGKNGRKEGRARDNDGASSEEAAGQHSQKRRRRKKHRDDRTSQASQDYQNAQASPDAAAPATEALEQSLPAENDGSSDSAQHDAAPQKQPRRRHSRRSPKKEAKEPAVQDDFDNIPF